MGNVKSESKLTFFEAASIIVGHGVGAGILSVPYLAAHNSFRETLLILLIGYAVALVLHFLIAELSLNNNGAQFVKCFDAELFSGKIKTIFTWTAFILLGVSVIVNVSAFLTGAAAVFRSWFGLPDLVKFIVEDSGFTDARPILKSQLGPAYGLIAEMNKHIAGYDLRDTDVSASLAEAAVPMLFVHGEDDLTVPFSNAPRAFGMCTSDKDCLFTAGTKHIETMHTHPEEYAPKLDAFIAKYIK